MRPSISRWTAAAISSTLGLVVVACGPGADASPSPSASPGSAASPGPTAALPTAGSAGGASAARSSSPSSSAEAPGDAEAGDPNEPVTFDLAGVVQGTSVMSGPDLIASMDPSDPAQAHQIAEIEALLEATDAGIDQLTMLNAVSADGRAFVGGLRLDRADIDIAKDVFVASMFDDLGEARLEEAELGGKPVTLVFDDEAPDDPPLVVYASAPIVWLISGPEASAIEVLEGLP